MRVSQCRRPQGANPDLLNAIQSVIFPSWEDLMGSQLRKGSPIHTEIQSSGPDAHL